MAPHKTWIPRAIFAGVCLLMLGTEGFTSASPEETLRFSRPAGKRMSREVGSWLTSCLRLDMVASAFTKFYNGQTYIFISSGVKPTRGFKVRVSRVDRTSDRALTVRASFTNAPKQSVASQQLTRPYDLVAIRDTGWAVTVIPEGNAAPFRIAGLVGVRELTSITSESRAIKIISPSPGCAVGRAFDVSGVALVFEGTVQMQLRNNRRQVIARTFATAASAMDWGHFRTNITVPDSVLSGTRLRLEFFTVDEEKGGETNRIRISLKLR